MSLVEFAVALWAFERWRGQPLGARELAIGGLLMAVLVGGLGLRHAIDPRRRLLAPEHLRELHALVTAASRGLDGTPQVRQTSRGVTVAVSTALGHGGHVSLSLRDHPCDLTLLCTLGAAAFPTALAESARVSGPGVLHVSLPSLPPAAPPPRESHSTLAAALQASAVRCAQSAEDRPPQASDDDPPATAGAVGLPGPATLQLARRTYFGDASSPSRMRA